MWRISGGPELVLLLLHANDVIKWLKMNSSNKYFTIFFWKHVLIKRMNWSLFQKKKCFEKMS